MTARRLVIVMLVLLGISALAAALVPTRESNDSTVGSTESTATETTGTGTTADTDGAKAVRKTNQQADRDHPPGSRCEADHDDPILTCTITVGKGMFPVVPLELGEQLTLMVRSAVPGQVEIPGLGMVSNTSPEAPARFDLLPHQAADLGVRFVDLQGAGRLAARIEVRPGAREGSGRPAEKRLPEPARS
jgi:hypothetical protein